MAYLQLKSTNPNLSYLLMKNPESGMTLRSYRQGTILGWFTPNLNDSVYNLYFKDGDDEVSFKKYEDEFEYNDTKRYNAPLFIQGAINEFFRQFTNGDIGEFDKPNEFINEVVINQMEIFNVKYIDLIQRYYTGFEVVTEELSPKNFRITISTNRTMRDLVNYTYILSMFYHCLTGFDEVWIEEGEMGRYTKILNNLDSPYFIRYVVKSRVIRSENKFKNIKADLEKCSFQNIDLVFGDTHTQRANFIIENISGSNEILDIGCNDMRSYGLKLAKRLAKTDTTYHAVDIDEDALDKAQRKVNNNALNNVVLYKHLDEFVGAEYTQKFDIILSEVFEHIELKEDTKIIKEMLAKVNFNKFIITTPNKDFNQYYQFTEDQTRLDEHVFEMSGEEFKEYFDTLLGKNNSVTYEFHNIGDTVNGVTPTQAVIISKK
jgi:2-polyprenyl-3-methyl-5-hydroxy-6-metoxy-1,4-benzoquinol methylase